MATMDLELYECERYRLMAGWSSDYLLVTDKCRYRIRNSTKSWKTFEDVDAALLSPGWAWEHIQDDQGQQLGWVADLQCENIDAEGWSYASVFGSSFEGGSSKTSLQKVVRWRRLIRTQTFSGTEALMARATALADASTNSSKEGDGKAMLEAGEAASLPPLCPHVDLEGAAHMQRLLPEAIAQASLYGSVWSVHTLILLKAQLLERLAGSETKEKETTLDDVLAGFVQSQKSMSTRMSETFSRKSHNDEAVARRLHEVEAKFPKAEIEAFTVLAIRRFRPDLACGIRDHAHDPNTCEWRTVSCPNPGCNHRCCAKDLARHDEVCAHKLISCEKCGEMVPRGEMKVHLLVACPEREAKCIFHEIGCDAPIKHKDLNDHLEEHTQAHMMLLMRELIQQREAAQKSQETIADLEAQCIQYKAEKEILQQKCNGMEQKVVGLETQVGVLEKKVKDELKKVTGPVEDLRKAVASSKDEAKKRHDASEKEAKKRFDSMEKSYKAEVNGLRTEISTLKDSHAEFSTLRAEIEALKGGLRGLESKVTTDGKDQTERLEKVEKLEKAEQVEQVVAAKLEA